MASDTLIVEMVQSLYGKNVLVSFVFREYLNENVLNMFLLFSNWG